MRERESDCKAEYTHRRATYGWKLLEICKERIQITCQLVRKEYKLHVH